MCGINVSEGCGVGCGINVSEGCGVGCGMVVHVLLLFTCADTC